MGTQTDPTDVYIAGFVFEPSKHVQVTNRIVLISESF